MLICQGVVLLEANNTKSRLLDHYSKLSSSHYEMRTSLLDKSKYRQ